MGIAIEDLHSEDFSDLSEGSLVPIHPGEILLEDFLKPMGITQYRLAKDIGVPHGVLVKLWRASALLPWIPACVSRAILG